MKTIRFPFTYTSLVVSGGHMKSISCIGCLAYLQEVGLLASIRNFIGTSAGSIMCLFAVLGFRPQDMVRFLMQNLTNDEISDFNIDNVFGILDTYGLSDGANIERFVSLMLHEKLKLNDITFIDLAKQTGKNLVVCVSNITKHQAEYWSVDTTPNVSVVTAIRASCSLPLIFTPVKYHDDLYIDGGLFDNFPMNYFQESNLKDVLGINVMSSNLPNKVGNITDYIYLVLQLVLKRITETHENDPKNNVVTLELQDTMWVSLTDMRINISKDVIEEYIMIGYIKMKELLEVHSNNIEKIEKITKDCSQTQ